MWKTRSKQLGNKLEFVAVNAGVNDKIDGVKRYVKSKGWNFQIVFDTNREIGKAFGISGIPMHIIVDRKGIIRYIGTEAFENIEKRVDEFIK